MSNSLLLHVGAPKTATTLVQWQFSGSDVLAANGVHYPEAGRDPDRIAHHVLGRMLMDCRAAEAAAMLQEEINPSGLTLVSSESMTNCIADPRRLPSFQAFLGATATSVESLRLLMFLREASDFFESMYLHAIKATGLKASFDDYLREREGWYGRLFANLATLASGCPRMAPDIRAFVPHAYAADWSDVLGFDPQLDASQRVNPRLSLKTQSLLKEYDAFCANTGLQMERLDAIDAFSAADSPFEDDLHDFSPYRPGAAEGIRQRVLDDARRHDRTEYVAAFGDAPARSAPVYAQIDYARLDQRDLDAAEAFLRAAQQDSDRAGMAPGRERARAAALQR